jgi:hypothetical protein
LFFFKYQFPSSLIIDVDLDSQANRMDIFYLLNKILNACEKNMVPWWTSCWWTLLYPNVMCICNYNWPVCLISPHIFAGIGANENRFVCISLENIYFSFFFTLHLHSQSIRIYFFSLQSKLSIFMSIKLGTGFFPP